MRNDYQKLYEQISAEDFAPDSLTKAEYAKLLVATMIIVSNIETRILSEQKSVKGYKDTIIPKLERIINECETDEAAKELAKKLFTIDEVK